MVGALQSLLEELKAESSRATMFHRRGVPYSRIKSLIRKYETQLPGDISNQPGAWTIRGGNVDAIQHDGTVIGTQFISEWLNERGGIFETFVERGISYIRLDSPRSPNIVGPGWWIVKTADGIFFAVSDADFHIVYVPRGEG